MASMNDLPNELVMEIFSHVPKDTAITMRLVNRRFAVLGLYWIRKHLHIIHSRDDFEYLPTLSQQSVNIRNLVRTIYLETDLVEEYYTF